MWQLVVVLCLVGLVLLWVDTKQKSKKHFDWIPFSWLAGIGWIGGFAGLVAFWIGWSSCGGGLLYWFSSFLITAVSFAVGTIAIFK